VVIISLILPLQYSVLKFANGQILKESQIMMFNSDSKTPVLDDNENTVLKPKVHVSIEGTTKSDKIKGGIGNDKINGEYGHDLLHGKDGSDKLNGGIGNDKISGQNGNDIIKGGKGDDMLFGGQGSDQLYGDIGNDVLDGGKENDIMIGGRGTDTFLCSQYDMVIDFNATEEDQMIGACKTQSQEVIAVSDNNISTKSQFESPQSSSSSSPTEKTLPSLPINANDTLTNFEHSLRFNPNNVHHIEFQSLPALPTPLNDIYMKGLQFN
jgi:RTX calcium-binding nonapeptide repeat (4 copies)